MKVLLPLLLTLALAACAGPNPHYVPERPHHRPDGFVNTDPDIRGGTSGLWGAIARRWRGDFRPAAPPVGGYPAFRQTWEAEVDHARLQQRPQEPTITWLGHAGALLQVGGINLLLDPQLNDYAGPTAWLSAQRLVPPPLRAAELPAIDAVLISHNHYDHLDDTTVRELAATQATAPRWLVPLGVETFLEQRQIGPTKALDWWDSVELGPLRIHFTPAQHWSKRTLSDTNATLWGGFLVEWTPADGGAPWRFLYTGDTGYSTDFRQIHDRLGAVDFLMVPVGTYEPRDFMRRQHVNPADAVRIFQDVGARAGLGVHWGTFALSREPLDQPPQDLAAALAAAGLPVDAIGLMKHGATQTIAR